MSFFTRLAVRHPILLAIAAGLLAAPVFPPLYSHHVKIFGVQSMNSKVQPFCQAQAQVSGSVLPARLYCLFLHLRR
jgi:hypothetical protein